MPGHHFQIALQQEIGRAAAVPADSGVFGDISRYIEGWGLYAERLADENGWYEGDPRRTPRLLEQHALPRAPAGRRYRHAREAVDAAAGDRLRHQAAAKSNATSSWPGQACAYMIGQLKIVELREKARAQAAAINFRSRNSTTPC